MSQIQALILDRLVNQSSGSSKDRVGRKTRELTIQEVGKAADFFPQSKFPV